VSDDAAPRAPGPAVCERHGLRFDAATQEGCVLCRRERAAGGAAPMATAIRSARAWAVAGLLWLVGGGVLFVAHRAVLDSFAAIALVGELAFGGDAERAAPAPD
jgi:hypothetical protein